MKRVIVAAVAAAAALAFAAPLPSHASTGVTKQVKLGQTVTLRGADGLRLRVRAYDLREMLPADPADEFGRFLRIRLTVRNIGRVSVQAWMPTSVRLSRRTGEEVGTYFAANMIPYIGVRNPPRGPLAVNFWRGKLRRLDVPFQVDRDERAGVRWFELRSGGGLLRDRARWSIPSADSN